MQSHMLSLAGAGATRNALTKGMIESFELEVPPLREQQAIACVLGALDDKIELNRRRNQTLEAMARAIFQSWFVDFDPVQAKAAVRREHPRWTNAQVSRAACPKLKPEIAELFPDRFEDSPLGPIPAGWRVGTLGEICEKPQYGFTAPAKEEPIGPRFLRITDINKTDWIEWDTLPFCDIDSDDRMKYALRTGDLVIARMADPGHSALIEENVDAVFASYLIRFRPKAINLQRYLQYWLRSSGYWQLVQSRQSGTTRANLNAQVLAAFTLLLPPSELLTAFTHVVEPLRNDLVSKVQESRTLAALRDALLPKLISGELRVPDAERIVGRAT
jgi:type I restriction enzyme S subunit